jgi:hypothetical protein
MSRSLLSIWSSLVGAVVVETVLAVAVLAVTDAMLRARILVGAHLRKPRLALVEVLHTRSPLAVLALAALATATMLVVDQILFFQVLPLQAVVVVLVQGAGPPLVLVVLAVAGVTIQLLLEQEQAGKAAQVELDCSKVPHKSLLVVVVAGLLRQAQMETSRLMLAGTVVRVRLVQFLVLVLLGLVVVAVVVLLLALRRLLPAALAAVGLVVGMLHQPTTQRIPWRELSILALVVVVQAGVVMKMVRTAAPV